jgi:probable phosphoglycerate mutase
LETHIYLIRHGETLWNREKRVQGHHDTPLSAEGIEQARRLAKYIKEWPLDAIYASDLSRAVQTAQWLGRDRGLEVKTSPEIRERYFGEWEGLPIEEVKRRHPDKWLSIWYRGGEYGVERAAETRQRMLAWLEGIVGIHCGQKVAAVSHGGSINAILEHLSQGVYGPGRTRIRNTAVSHLIHRSETGWEVFAVNRDDHLLTG